MRNSIPNLLTASRILLGLASSYLVIHQELYLIAGLLFIICISTDILDGYLSRTWNCTSKIGKFLDPFADKILIIGVLIGLILHGKVIKSLAILLISRDLIMDLLRIFIYRKKVIPASNLGKIKTSLQMAGILLILMSMGSGGTCHWFWISSPSPINIISHIILAIASIFSLLSFVIYIQKIYKNMS